MNYVWTVITLAALFTLLAMSLNLVMGYVGALSLAHAAFYGIGAYTASLLMLHAGLGLLPATAGAVLVTALISLLAAAPSVTLRGDYFVLATLGLQMIVSSVLYNWLDVTNGPYGLGEIPAPAIAGIRFDTPAMGALLCVAACLFVGGGLALLVHSPFGRLLRALRSDELAVAAIGKSPLKLKTLAFAIAAGLAAIPGALFASMQRFIEPTSFALSDSIVVVSMVAIGGAGTFSGPLTGAVGLVLLREGLRFLSVPDAYAANLRELVYGLIMIVLMRVRPQGLRGNYGFD